MSVSVTFHHTHGGSTIVDAKDEARYKQLLADQGIGITSIEHAMVCDACHGMGIIATPYCHRRKAHAYHFGKCRKPCAQCAGKGEFPLAIASWALGEERQRL